ncbi:MAG: hypothetical protein WCT10_04150 [Patescibacteria group bacterium]
MADNASNRSFGLDDDEIIVVSKNQPRRVIKGDQTTALAVSASPDGADQLPAAATVPATALPTSVVEKKPDVSKFDSADLIAAGETARAEQKADSSGMASEADCLDAAVADAVKASGVRLNDFDLEKRYQTAVNLFFRDLRDALETRSKLTMSRGSGGMGLDDAEADRVMALLEAKVAAYRGLIQSANDAARQRYLATQAEKVLNVSEQAQTKEVETLERRFSEITQRSGSAAAAPPFPVQPAVPSTPKIITVVDAAAIHPAVSAEPETINIELVPSAAKAPPPPGLPVVRAEEAPTPEPAAPAQVQIPALTEIKPVVSDVKFASKLLGPVEELRAMTIKDFRRLSRDPHEATLKITDKIDLLKEESFEKRTAGIRGWQESEANRLYLELLRSSLEGRPIMEIIAEKESKGENVLNKAEFDAIMELNRKLRFG